MIVLVVVTSRVSVVDSSESAGKISLEVVASEISTAVLMVGDVVASVAVIEQTVVDTTIVSAVIYVLWHPIRHLVTLDG